tara:strand:+ start:485 stop:907 length:423 start_codon:yes stop_codon:yes gene_type:complete
MKNTICLTYNINPIPASRPRVTRWGTYYGKRYSNFKKEMKERTSYESRENLKNTVIWIEGLIFADMTFFIPMARSWSKKKKSLKNGQYCDNNADLDNYEKAILDSLNGIYFKDDRQIVSQKSQKIWADKGKIKIILREVE